MNKDSHDKKNSISGFFDVPTNKELHIDKDNYANLDKESESDSDLDQEDDDSDIDLDQEDDDSINQKPHATTYDTDPYIFDDKQYSFLNDNILSQKFGDFMDVDKQYNVQICIFKINSDCDIPFLEYMFDKSSKTLVFPSINFHCPPSTAHVTALETTPYMQPNIRSDNINIGGNTDIPKDELEQEKQDELEQEKQEKMPKEESMHFSFESFSNSLSNSLSNLPSQEYLEESNTEHTFFMNECSQELLKVLPIHDIFNSETLQKIYKGFIENENTLYVVFDSTKVLADIDETKYTWIILDEILNQKKSLDKEISQEICEMFQMNPFMKNIVDDKGKKLIQPSLLYLCTKPDEIYKNVQDQSPTGTIDILEEPIDHPWFGNFYYFSSKPLDGADLTKINRYAVFTYNARYILKDVDLISSEEKERFNESLEDTENDNYTIYFREGGIQLWCIKSSEQFTLL